ncbi:VOC family protein [Lysinibacillus sphaericus]|uniref:Glutathione transferase n=1 Tax=Lysinibacillus sphaericus TaxID=1421 RepID=A0A2S0JZL2_LYSSH|nr:VOC family protein [Lysinibacillus sphaericus]AVK96557.1 glutathione transferase [Lysinibacillus sphaericus]MED4542913.1 VOC family protein [Lysinibacillus sphaericus]TKI19800.1 VOC family protein [Lysinibacillus sphaericus]SUV17647.1 glutathione transferase [Lysinibacillus sphaericus]GEC81218.1 extradiol dioxygenase [Lysinibacillus sphaericus]
MIKGLYEAHLPVSDLQQSIIFYEKLGLELAYVQQQFAFFWIVKGQSWIGLWECKEAQLDYHPSIRHLAFKIDEEDAGRVKQWLQSIGIEIKTAFGFTPSQQPLVLPNHPHAHAAIYFADPDGNSIELITPLRLDVAEEFPMMSLATWYNRDK